MLNIFLKKKPAESDPARMAAEQLEEKPARIDDIAIHAMPERYRQRPNQAESTKLTGLLVIGGGLILLILILAFSYFYFLKKPAATIKPAGSLAADNSAPNQPSAPADQAPASEGPAATSTEPAAC